MKQQKIRERLDELLDSGDQSAYEELLSTARRLNEQEERQEARRREAELEDLLDRMDQ